MLSSADVSFVLLVLSLTDYIICYYEMVLYVTKGFNLGFRTYNGGQSMGTSEQVMNLIIYLRFHYVFTLNLLIFVFVFMSPKS